MTTAEKAVQMTAQLYEMRRMVRSMLGDRYKAKMADYGAAIKQVAELKSIKELPAAIELGKVAQAEGNDMVFICVMAAYVELAEPRAEGVSHG